MPRRVPLTYLTLILATSLAGCSIEQFETHYETASAAHADGAITRGWIPDWLPDAAVNIRERHDLDTNDSVLRFELPSGVPMPRPDHCDPIVLAAATPARLRATWWPEWNEVARDFELFTCTDARDPSALSTGTLGINQAERVWIYW
ncbi:hypothetical protein C7S18_13300 [Ahniella affigens]|uniref:YbbD head domain-containing protein n=1 Tax=Ahniella affigens TaxID=2021234 RepID=A0A2P1PTE3_9GAMM|nr:hypothetical protein [Ahniella affigens]AVP98113.1 hypothetical protein C7S18_13300 [Ahniella affigens]